MARRGRRKLTNVQHSRNVIRSERREQPMTQPCYVTYRIVDGILVEDQQSQRQNVDDMQELVSAENGQLEQLNQPSSDRPSIFEPVIPSYYTNYLVGDGRPLEEDQQPQQSRIEEIQEDIPSKSGGEQGKSRRSLSKPVSKYADQQTGEPSLKECAFLTHTFTFIPDKLSASASNSNVLCRNASIYVRLTPVIVTI
ncbi:hypothetical protein PAAG_03327 [Paracoccidioides lutzii Pb01]|uniref:Uncharacterized protein n=1 Tax=Paracoccidioides lutzii (strain ATCC MYA-826 / Pb01) TaxID=502779 RepID=C1GWV3_PARBA|nr:hypothetical protein PAAG_03327 [Paracoccidioides lutzii Pb01]EEH41041.2 hypothetical protein PAAG_03327 [Paracoccidioides lutzii Pb01]